MLVNASGLVLVLRKHVEAQPASATSSADRAPPRVTAIHLVFLASVVLFAHHPVIFLGLLLLFLGFTQAYARYQSPLILKEALLVAFFLAGLVVLGGMQQWWLQPIVAGRALPCCERDSTTNRSAPSVSWSARSRRLASPSSCSCSSEP